MRKLFKRRSNRRSDKVSESYTIYLKLESDVDTADGNENRGEDEQNQA